MASGQEKADASTIYEHPDVSDSDASDFGDVLRAISELENSPKRKSGGDASDLDDIQPIGDADDLGDAQSVGDAGGLGDVQSISALASTQNKKMGRSVSVPTDFDSFGPAALADDPDSARRAFREGYQSFRLGKPQGAKGETPMKKIPSRGLLSRSLPELFSKNAEQIRARYDALAILEGIEVLRMPTFSFRRSFSMEDMEGAPPHANKRRGILQLAAVALLCETCCQLQVSPYHRLLRMVATRRV